MNSPKKFILYDGRAKSGDTDDATILVVADNEEEAQVASKDYKGVDAIWFEYQEIKGSQQYKEIGSRPDIGKGILT